jgi:nucleotide-binding universal stress UspA family protein
MKLLDKILLCIDFLEENNESLVNMAAYLFRVFNSEVTILNVVPDKTDDQEVKSYFQRYADDQMKNLIAELGSKGVNRLNPLLLTGNPLEKILETSEKEEFNVILAGPGKNGSNPNSPGVTIRKLIRKTSVPVWVVRPGSSEGLQHILCPVDFSDASKRALANAVLLATKMKAELRIFSVFEPLEMVSRRISTNLDEYNQKSLASYKDQFKDFLKGFTFSNIKYSTEILFGKPERIILKELKTGKYDLLLMGTTGRTGINRILVGSVTEKVIEDCPVSFITTKNRNILNPEFELKISSLETLLNKARECMKEGDYARAAVLFEKAMMKDDMLIPAVQGAAEAYEKLQDSRKAMHYRQHAEEIIKRLYGGGEVFRKLEA